MVLLPVWIQPLAVAAESVEAPAVVQASVALAAAPVVPVGAAAVEGEEGEEGEPPAPVAASVRERALILARSALRYSCLIRSRRQGRFSSCGLSLPGRLLDWPLVQRLVQGWGLTFPAL